MQKRSVLAILCCNALTLACGESSKTETGLGGGAGTATNAGTGGNAAAGAAGAPANPSSGGTGADSGSGAIADAGALPPVGDAAAQGHHLGKPFIITNGRIGAETNDYGLEASFYVVHNPKDAAVNVTSTTGQVCVDGVLRRAVTGDFASYQGLDIGFSVGPTGYRTLTETSLSIAPDAPPWELDGRVLGISVTVTGLTPILFGFLITPGGQDPGGQYGMPIDLTLFSTCNHPPITASGQVSADFFADMKNVWCIPEYQQSWTANNIAAFFWSIGSVVVDELGDAGSDATDPYDFCLSNIRPILAGAGPDDPPSTVPDGGGYDAGEAGSLN